MVLRPGLVVALCGLCLFSCSRQSKPLPPASTHGADILLPVETVTARDVVPSGATMSVLLRDLQLRSDLIPAIIEKTRAVWNPRELRAGHTYELTRTLDGLLRSFQYEIDIDNFLRVTAGTGQQATTIAAEVVPYDNQHVQASVRGAIDSDNSSLFAAMEQAGEGPDLPIALADIFSGEIDFHSELQVGDTFSLVFERIVRDGRTIGYGRISAAEFDNAGRKLKAILFTPPGGKPGYYDENGRSLVRFFLKSPLKFIPSPHVTSGFSRNRYHPVLRIYRPHLGVDYRAPQGSPVVAVANGVVVSAGWNGEGGRTIHLRHAQGYETYYMHLSAILVRAGQHVSQGQVIGRVGMTGLATGPHLDYRIRQNGTFRNPLTVHRSLPPGEPIPAGAMAQFNAERDRLLGELAAAVAGPAPSRAAQAEGTGKTDAPARQGEK